MQVPITRPVTTIQVKVHPIARLVFVTAVVLAAIAVLLDPQAGHQAGHQVGHRAVGIFRNTTNIFMKGVPRRNCSMDLLVGGLFLQSRLSCSCVCHWCGMGCMRICKAFKSCPSPRVIC
jgi:hypothetical protein